MLVEVLVTAVLVVVVALGILAGFDGAAATSGELKARAMGAGVGQEDQERLRTFKVSDLSNLRQTRTRDAGGVPYTVDSRADWVTDSSGTASCTSADARADYLQITSTITWPHMGAVKPIVASSLVAPPNGTFDDTQGSLAVQVRDRNAVGTPSIPVTLSGPQGESDLTNSLGCVLWGYLPAGNGYTVSLDQTGYVDHQGVTAVSKSVGVTGGATNTVAFDYDEGGTVAVTFDTEAYGVTQTASWPQLSVGHSSLIGNGTLQFPPTPAGNQASITAGPLFPNTDPYTVFSGDCPNNSPGAYDNTYFSSNPGLVTIPPGSAAAPVKIHMPSLSVTVQDTVNGSTVGVNGATVWATDRSQGCSGSVNLGLTQDVGGVGGSFSGKLASPALPFGTYDVCVLSGTRRAIRTGNLPGGADLRGYGQSVSSFPMELPANPNTTATYTNNNGTITSATTTTPNPTCP